MTDGDRLRRVMLAVCGECWAESTQPCTFTRPQPVTELPSFPYPIRVHQARVNRAREKGLLEEDPQALGDVAA